VSQTYTLIPYTPLFRSEAGPLLGFTAVPTSESDDIVVPEGYSFQVILPWGTPILGAMPPFAIENTGEEQAMQMGSHHDGMHFFPDRKSTRLYSSHVKNS